MFDTIIVGGGPSGLTAAIYNARAGLKTVIIEKMALGGQIFLTAEIENFPGFENISGPELVSKMDKQAEKFGIKKIYDEIAEIKEADNNMKIVKGASGSEYKAYAVIISTGAKYRDLGVEGESKFRGRGVSNCATCDGAFYKEAEIAVVGGGDTAVEEAVYLTRFAKKVYIIHRRDKLRAAKSIQEKAFSNSKISFIWDSVVEEITGKTGVEGLKLKNVKTGEKSELAAMGVFIFAGLLPNTDFLKGFLDMDEMNYIKTDNDMRTSKPGIFACGDCISKSFRQAITACGDGATAANSAEKYVEGIKD
ncbi:MAG TPA: thioredoxin-disulfide reductase [Firmicutes bacterium]|nr:thioredoxin-disulfide reductase [Bacillota bacterium]